MPTNGSKRAVIASSKLMPRLTSWATTDLRLKLSLMIVLTYAAFREKARGFAGGPGAGCLRRLDESALFVHAPREGVALRQFVCESGEEFCRQSSPSPGG